MQRSILNIAAALAAVWMGGMEVRTQESGNAMFDRLSALEKTSGGSFRSDAEFQAFPDGRIDFEAVYRPLSAKEGSKR